MSIFYVIVVIIFVQVDLFSSYIDLKIDRSPKFPLRGTGVKMAHGLES